VDIGSQILLSANEMEFALFFVFAVESFIIEGNVNMQLWALSKGRRHGLFGS